MRRAAATKNEGQKPFYSPLDRRRIAGLSLAEDRTVARWERGETVRPTIAKAIEQAARKLGLPVPECRKEPRQ